MRATTVLAAICILCFVCACAPRAPVLEPYALRLQPRMNTADVARVFTSCRVLSAGQGTAADITLATVFFQTDATCAAWTTYIRDYLPLETPETCTVYFDSMGIIIAYTYLGYDGRVPDVEKHRATKGGRSDVDQSGARVAP